MTQAGGSATINGILYQTLGALDWESRITLELQLAEGLAPAATLVIEPAGGGGDLQIVFPQKRLVEQWKAKSDAGTWSLNKIIDDVLPDLYRAVNGARLDEEVEYWFVTEGRRGDWEKAQAFFAGLDRTPPQDPSTVLDDQAVVTFSPLRLPPARSLVLSRRGLFELIVGVLRDSKLIRDNETVEVTRRKLWHLLSRLHLREEEALVAVQQKVEQRLAGLVEHRRDVIPKREQLCGLVMDLAAQGQVQLDAGELLRRAGLYVYPFTAWKPIRRLLVRRLGKQLGMSGYVPALDVCPAPQWPAGKSILVLSGDSGQGKSWQLAALASATAAEDGFVTWAQSTDNAAADLQASANEVWQQGLNHTNELSFDRVASIRAQIHPDAPRPWLTVCIDDIQTFSEARRLVRNDWEGWGARLAITVPAVVANALRNEFADRVQVVPVQDFTIPQLQDCLARRNRNWNSVPKDVQQTLRRPLLSDLYCKVADDPNWKPDSEYELYDRAWQKLTGGTQADYPLDIVHFQDLALRALDPQIPYPWPADTVAQAGINNETQRRLIATGWLRQASPVQVAVWHDRLLNWAVAASLVQQRLNGKRDAGWLADHLRALSAWQLTPRTARLGYVAADVLWLASGGENHEVFAAELPCLIVAMEGDRYQGEMMVRFYRDLLSTLGEQIIPALIERLRMSHGLPSRNPYPRYVAACLAQIARRTPSPVVAASQKMLRDASSAEVQEAALRLLAVVPADGLLEELWTLHVQSQQNLRDHDDRVVETHERYQLTSRALNACLTLDPQWLTRKIDEVDPGTAPAAELAYALANLAGRGGEVIWPQVKRTLMTKVPPDKRRSLARCIERYRDAEEKDVLISWLPHEDDFLGPAAFGALAVVDPDAALAHLQSSPMRMLSFCSNWWLPELLTRCPKRTHEALRRWMLENPGDTAPIASSYAHYVNEMDPATLDLLLDDLTAQCAERAASVGLLRLLARVSRWELLERFTARAGTDTERRLADLAIGCVENQSAVYEVALMRDILLKMGGEGTTRLMNTYLSSPDQLVRFDKIPFALARPDEATRSLLGQLTLSADVKENVVQRLEAVEALAELGESSAVFAAILQYGTRCVTPTTAKILQQHPLTIGDEQFALVVQTLKDGPDAARANACLAMGFTGRRDHVERILKIGCAVDPGSDLAYATLFALNCLGADAATVVDLARVQLGTTTNRFGAREILLRRADTLALDAVEEDFDRDPNDQDRWQVGRHLCKDTARRSRVIARLWEMVQQSRPLGGADAVYDLVAELGTDEVQNFLWGKAHPATNSSIQEEPLSALCGLVKLVPDAALRAAAAELTSHGTNRPGLASLLAEHDPMGSVHTLCEVVINEPTTEVRWAIGRILRLHPNGDEVARRVEIMMSALEPATRRIGAELCGWLSTGVLDGSLETLAQNDQIPLVRAFAKAAQQRRRNEELAVELVGKLGQLIGVSRWAVLEALLKIADPSLLVHKLDPLGFEAVASSLGAAAWRVIGQRIKERTEEEEKRAKESDEAIRQD